MNDLCFVKAIDGFGEGVVVAVADAADGWFDAGLRQSFGVFNGDVLAAPVAVVNKASAVDGSPFVQRLLQCIEHEAGMGGPTGAPSHDPAGISVDY